MDNMTELLAGLRREDVWDIWPDYPCRRCKTFREGNGDACRCGKWQEWFSRVWRTYYREVGRSE